MPHLRIRKRWWVLAALLLLCGWLLTTDNTLIWPVRNSLWYEFDRRWNADQTAVDSEQTVLTGCLRSTDQQPVTEGYVLASEPDGTLHEAPTGADGCYRLTMPAGRYAPVALAPGFELTTLADGLWTPAFAADQTYQLTSTLDHAAPAAVPEATAIQLGPTEQVTVDIPQPATVLRRQLTFQSVHQTNQLTYVYTPLSPTQSLPTLLAVYPGTAAEWQGVSIPLAAAGYTVVAVGPAYSFYIERDILELRQLASLIRRGTLPHARGDQLVVLGGSYSSIHVMRLIEDDAGFAGAILLGPISDAFDLRERFENQGFIPPFDLDKVLVALGWPNRNTARYARYSPLWHVRPDWPPMLVLHSHQDEVVPSEQSVRLVEELERHAVPVEAHIFDGMSHYLYVDKPSAELDQLYAIALRFLEEVTE